MKNEPKYLVQVRFRDANNHAELTQGIHLITQRSTRDSLLFHYTHHSASWHSGIELRCSWMYLISGATINKINTSVDRIFLIFGAFPYFLLMHNQTEPYKVNHWQSIPYLVNLALASLEKAQWLKPLLNPHPRKRPIKSWHSNREGCRAYNEEDWITAIFVHRRQSGCFLRLGHSKSSHLCQLLPQHIWLIFFAQTVVRPSSQFLFPFSLFFSPPVWCESLHRKPELLAKRKKTGVDAFHFTQLPAQREWCFVIFNI